MVLDHDSGRMEGRCLKVRFAGRELSSLIESELLQLLSELRSIDLQGTVLMEGILIDACEGGATVTMRIAQKPSADLLGARP